MILTDITQRYGSKTVLSIPHLEFERGQIYAIIGSNGCGKSTMVRIACGISKPTEGSVTLAPGEVCGYMPQKSYAFYGTLEKNVELGLPSHVHDKERVNQVLEDLKLANLKTARAKSLSGGETSRMALARLLVGENTVIGLDESTASLDVNSTLIAEKLICRYKEAHNACVIMITHSLSQAMRISDKVVFLDHGRVFETGETKETLSHPQTAELKEFIEIA